jgi:hypothetical protein
MAKAERGAEIVAKLLQRCSLSKGKAIAETLMASPADVAAMASTRSSKVLSVLDVLKRRFLETVGCRFPSEVQDHISAASVKLSRATMSCFERTKQRISERISVLNANRKRPRDACGVEDNQ